MPPSSSILIFGHDAILLHTRCLILERAGFRVSTVSQKGEVVQILSDHSIDLVILCQTVLPAEREEISDALLALFRQPQLLHMLPGGRYGVETPWGHMLDILIGPQALIETVRKILKPDNVPQVTN